MSVKSEKIVLIIIVIVSLAATLVVYKEPVNKTMPKTISVLDIHRCNNNVTCMDGISGILLESKSAKELLAELDDLGKTDSSILVQCHPITHSVGRSLYKKLSEEGKHIADVFQQCDHTCHSGCFHGAMERLFLSASQDGHITPQILREKAPTICTSFEYGLEGNLRFQCLHGLGHAILFFNNYNLTDSLKICDLLSIEWDASSCYGGTFMENLVAFDKSKRYVNSDPHFPCNALEEKYKEACYMMQTSRMSELGLSDTDISKECEKAGKYRGACMQSLGRDRSNIARNDPKLATVCTTLNNTNGTQACINGLIYALIDNSWDGRYAFPYCDTLPNNYLFYCYNTSIAYLKNSLHINKTTILNSCTNYSNYLNCTTLVNAS